VKIRLQTHSQTAFLLLNRPTQKKKVVWLHKTTSPLSPVHYIPHHHVIKDSKTTPIRIVCDCRCRLSHNHPSLNDCLMIGPLLVNDLYAILLQFHVHQFALSTNIVKAFLHVKLDANDQDFYIQKLLRITLTLKCDVIQSSYFPLHAWCNIASSPQQTQFPDCL